MRIPPKSAQEVGGTIRNAINRVVTISSVVLTHIDGIACRI